ncbi:hypothetical protein [Streptomyces niveus]|uniref:hypothetical protein n=1 Tax=Streptomyces niveus TaxID=193462 RepID=UPI0033A9F82E
MTSTGSAAEAVSEVCCVGTAGASDPNGIADLGWRFWNLFEHLAETDASTAIRLLGAFLARGLRRAATAGHGHPFNSGHLSASPGSHVGAVLAEAVERAPAAVLEHVLPFVIAVAKASHADHADGPAMHPRWARPPLLINLELDEALYSAVHDALRALAQRHPSSVVKAVELLASSVGRALSFLACRTYAVWNRLDEALAWLTNDVERSTRGEAALAIGSLLRATDAIVQQLLPMLSRLAQDLIMAVRACAAEAVTALMHHAPEAALELTDALFTGVPVDSHEARTSHILLTQALLRDTERFAPELNRALVGPELAARHAGVSWAVLAMRGRLIPCLPTNSAVLTLAARRGAAEAAANDPTHRASLLPEMFHDGDATVRKAAAHSTLNVASLPPGIADDLIGSFLSRSAFFEHPETLARGLAGSTLRLPSQAIEACRALSVFFAQASKDGRRGYALIQKYLIEVVLRLYLQGDPAIRVQCLNIIDDLYRVDARGLNNALSGER